jgi:hypothetical protein
MPRPDAPRERALAPSTPPLPRRRAHAARLPGHHPLTRLFERLPEQFGRLGTGQGDLAINDEERHTRHAEVASPPLPGADGVQARVARQQFVYV